MLPLVVLGALVATFVIYKASQRDPTHAPGRRELDDLSEQDDSLRKQLLSNEAELSEAKRKEAKIDREARDVQARLASMEAKAYSVQMDREQLERKRKEFQQKTYQLQEEKKATQLERKELDIEGARLREAQAEVHRQQEWVREINARDWPRPAWLRDGCHVGVTGRTGAGKSSLINTMLEDKVADVGVTETTLEPSMYTARRGPLKGLVVCDMPGAGTEKFPADSYIKEMGIRYFYTLMIVTATRFETTDYNLFHEARRWDIPCYLVRSRVDGDIENNRDDHGRSAEETVAKIRGDLISNIKKHKDYTPEDDSRVFVVSAKPKSEQTLLLELERLTSTILKDMDERSGPSANQPSGAAVAARPKLGADGTSRGLAAAAGASIGRRGLATSLADPQPAVPAAPLGERTASAAPRRAADTVGSMQGSAALSAPTFAPAAGHAGSTGSSGRASGMQRSAAAAPAAQPAVATGYLSTASRAGAGSSTPSFAMAAPLPAYLAAAAGAEPLGRPSARAAQTYTGLGMQAPSPLQSDRLWKKAEAERLALGR